MTLLGDAPTRVFELIEKHEIQCEAGRNGTLHCAHSAPASRNCACGRRIGPPAAYRWICWIVRPPPRRSAATISTERLLDRRTGTIQPLGYARGLAAAAIQTGARILTRTPVRSLARRDGRWRARSDRGTASSRSVILATNAYTEAVAPIARCVVPFSFFQLATPPLPKEMRETILPGGHGAWDTAKILTSLRLDGEGRLIVGSIGRLDPGRRGIHASWMRRKTRQMFPQLGSISFEHGWYGTIGTTGDHLPRISQPEEGVIAVYGYNGRGIGPGTVFGRVLADYVLSDGSGELPLPLTPMTPEPMRWLRALGIEAGVRAHHFVSSRF